MIAEPYIAKTGPHAGELHWHADKCECGPHSVCEWLAGCVPYADFEREKLKELKNVKAAYCGFEGITISCQDCYWVLLSRTDCKNKRCKFPWQTLHGDREGEKQHCHHYGSAELTGYTPTYYNHDSESNRLLKRAEFLKAVCEREGVEWLPNKECMICGGTMHPTKLNYCEHCEGRKEKCSKCKHSVENVYVKCSCSCHQKPEKCWNCDGKGVEPDYFTRDEEREFRRALLKFLGMGYKEIDSIAKRFA